MALLNEQQRQSALEVMREWLSAARDSEGETSLEKSARGRRERDRIIEGQLRPLVEGYMQGTAPLPKFKSRMASINARQNRWGFNGAKGQMFFNMVVNVADDLQECDRELKSALGLPGDEKIASSRIRRFAAYVKRLRDRWVEAGHTRHRCPKLGSIPFFLSYFWHVQDCDTWPIYYTNSVQMMADLNLWQPSGDLAEDYLSFKRVHDELAALFTEDSGQPIDPYTVGSVFWHKHKLDQTRDVEHKTQHEVEIQQPAVPPKTTGEPNRLPESYVPPIVAILPRMARHEEALVEAAKRSGTTLERAFEKHINAAFTIFGYETRLLGQGKGRVPDGLALAREENYAILWDAKVRADAYSMGTDDRTIREYITRQSRELKKRLSIRNIYYTIVSSTFADDYRQSIRSIKMETVVSEVTLLEAEALVAMVQAKLQAPLEITLGPDGLQRLFATSTVVRADRVWQELGLSVCP